MERSSPLPMPHNPNHHDASLDEALQSWRAALAANHALEPLPGESVPLDQALGRITVETIWAKINNPHYHAAAMDGYAIRADETTDAQPSAPRYLILGQQAIPIDTGDPIPGGYNAIIMVEQAHQVTQLCDGQEHLAIEVTNPVTPWHHVRLIGEDIRVNTLVVPSNHRLRPPDIGAIAGAGHTNVNVRRQPRIAILPTGSELVEPGTPLKPGDIIEYNSLMLAAAAQASGALATRLPKVADAFDQIKTAVQQALFTHDLVIVNAGSSAGREDYTAAVFRSLGTVVVQGIAMRPGHPAILAYAEVELKLENGQKQVRKALAGLPGYPVSAAITFDLLIKPLLACWQGQSTSESLCIEAVLAHDVDSSPAQDEFLRVSLAQVGKRIIAIPLARSAGTIMSLARADGLIHLRRGHTGYRTGDAVTVALQSSIHQICDTLVMVGMVDHALEVLVDEFSQQHPGSRLLLHAMDAVGAFRCLMCNQAHLAVSYLRDRGTGEYNLPSTQQPVSEQRVLVVEFVEQGQKLIDLFIASDYANDARVEKLCQVLQSECFKQRIRAINGYKVNNSGGVIAQLEIKC